MLDDVQEASLTGGLFRLDQTHLLGLHRFPVPLAGGGQDRLGLLHPAPGYQPPGGLRQPDQQDGANRHQAGDAWDALEDNLVGEK